MYTGLQSHYTKRTINKREPEWIYDDSPKLREGHFRPEDSVGRRMICVKKQAVADPDLEVRRRGGGGGGGAVLIYLPTNNYLFRYGADELENVKSYKYLGLIMSPFGNFNLARQELKKVALKALYKLRKEMGNHFRENIKLTMKLFEALISRILFYASEVWGIDCTGKLEKDPAELVQNKFLKWLLQQQCVQG